MDKLKEKMKAHLEEARQMASLEAALKTAIQVHFEQDNSEEKSENALHVCVVLDASSSMYPLANETVKGFNGYVQELKDSISDKDVYLTLISFNSNHGSKKIYNHVPIDAVEPLGSEYHCEGMTPLLDAVMEGIEVNEGWYKDGDGVAVTIITDGYENASIYATSGQVRDKIKSLEKKGWTFTFMGANIDAFAAAEGIGIPQARSLSYDQQFQGNAVWSAAAGSHSRYSNNMSEGLSSAVGSSSFTAEERNSTKAGNQSTPLSSTKGE